MNSPVERVVYILRHYPQLSQTFVRNEIFALRAAGHRVDVFSMQPTDTSHIAVEWSGPYEVMPIDSLSTTARVTAWWLTRHPVRLLRALACVGRLHRRDLLRPFFSAHLPMARRMFDTGVVACHTHFAWDAVAPTAILGRLLKVQSSVTVHAKDIYQPNRDTARRLDSVDELVTVCQYNVDYLSSSGLTSKPVTVVPCGVEPPSHLLPIEGASIVSVGRLIAKKGFAGLLDAFVHVHALVPAATLTIVGDGPLLEDLRKQATGLGLDDAVTFTGPLNASATLDAIASASVFVLNCTPLPNGDSDALPVVLREAMVRGRPTISTAVAGIPELLAENRGWLIPPGDLGALTSALIEALTNAQEAESRAHAARSFVLESGTLQEAAFLMTHVLNLGASHAPRFVFSGTVVSNGGDAAIQLAQRSVVLSQFPTAEIVTHDSAPAVARSIFPTDASLSSLWQAAWRPKVAARLRPALATSSLWRIQRAARIRPGRARTACWGLMLTPAERRTLRSLAAADAIIYAGGTSLIEKYDLAPKFFELSVALDLGKPVVLMPQSLGPFSDPGTTTRVRGLLRRATAVFLRDSRSLRHLQEIGADTSRTVVVPDIVFALADAAAVHRLAASQLDLAGARVGISVRDCTRFFDGDTRAQQRRFEQAVADLATWLCDQGAHVTFISTCQGLSTYWIDDSATAQSVVALMPDAAQRRTMVDDTHRTPEEYLAAMADLDLVVSTRLHGAILALCAGTPVLPIAYEFKTEEVMQDLGLSDVTLDVRTMTGDSGISAASRLISSLPDRRVALADSVAALSHAARDVGPAVSRALQQGRK